jgi:hypothetical protein
LTGNRRAGAAAGFGRITAGEGNRRPDRDSWLDRAIRVRTGGDRVVVYRQPAGRGVGRLLADGEVRIAYHDEEGIREVEPRGSSITKGYLDSPESNHAALTADGWNRTGDLGFVDHEEPSMARDFERWLAPTGRLQTALALAFYALNRLLMRGLFRLRVTDAAKLLVAGAFVITPITSAISTGWESPRHCRGRNSDCLYWAGDAVRMFSNPLNRLLCRALLVFPVDAGVPGATLESSRRVLRAGQVQVWFPDTWRSPDGRLQRFLPGIGQLLLRSGGACGFRPNRGRVRNAAPRRHRMPRLRQITVTFGGPEPVEILRTAGTGRTDEERISAALRERVAVLGAASGGAVGAEVRNRQHPRLKTARSPADACEMPRQGPDDWI